MENNQPIKTIIMESRFNKYKSETKSTSTQIAYINSFVDYVYTTGLDVIENEINSLQSKIDNGIAPPIFTKKKRRKTFLLNWVNASKGCMRHTILVKMKLIQ